MNRVIFLLVLITFSTIQLSKAQEVQQKIPDKTRLLFLLDGSGSMLAPWENALRIQVAKKFLADFVDSLRTNDQLELALRVYGHQYHRRLQRCNDSKLEVGFSPDNHDAIINKLKTIQPQGTTPIAYSLEQAANDFPIDPDVRNIIIIITDGIESCEGDPCAVSLALQKKGIFLKPFVIGIGMDRKFEEAFGCMGKFYDAKNISAFKKALNEAVNQSLGETTVSVELLDHQRQPTETNVNVTFINNFTGIPAFDFVHYRDANGRPDTVEIDPVLNYDIVVNTVPPVIKKSAPIEAGRHNVIPIQCPQGSLTIDLPGASEYRDGVGVLIKKDNATVLNTTVNTTDKLLAGTYDVEVMTLPRRSFKDVHIAPKSNISLPLKQPGVINIFLVSNGVGSLYEIDGDGQQRWIANISTESTRQSYAIQPGRYKLVFRSFKARGSKYTHIKNFDISSGGSMTIRF